MEARNATFCMKRGVGSKSKSQVNREYFLALEQWLIGIRSYSFPCHLLAGLPYSMMGQQINASSPIQNQTTNFVPPPPPPPVQQDFGMFMFPRPQQPQVVQDQGTEYKIPPLWKRFTAEFVDFMLLFLMKLAITFIAVDYFDFVDLDDIEILQKKHNEMDYKLAIEMTSGIIVLETIHRLIVCIYEGIFLHKGVQNQIGGATPGKTLMGIKVVLCYNVQQVGNDTSTVKVFPATNLGIGWSLARAVFKNLVLALLFPIFLPLFFNKFHRTSYDILCNSIVVEERSMNPKHIYVLFYKYKGRLFGCKRKHNKRFAAKIKPCTRETTLAHPANWLQQLMRTQNSMQRIRENISSAKDIFVPNLLHFQSIGTY